MRIYMSATERYARQVVKSSFAPVPPGHPVGCEFVERSEDCPRLEGGSYVLSIDVPDALDRRLVGPTWERFVLPPGVADKHRGSLKVHDHDGNEVLPHVLTAWELGP